MLHNGKLIKPGAALELESLIPSRDSMSCRDHIGTSTFSLMNCLLISVAKLNSLNRIHSTVLIPVLATMLIIQRGEHTCPITLWSLDFHVIIRITLEPTSQDSLDQMLV